jgi:CRP-like cAMP-binding protein
LRNDIVEGRPPIFVVALDAGKGFGDAALINDAPRGASIRAETNVWLARLSKENYRQIMGVINALAKKEKSMFLRRVKLFRHFDTTALRSVADRMVMQIFEKGCVITKQGELKRSV